MGWGCCKVGWSGNISPPGGCLAKWMVRETQGKIMQGLGATEGSLDFVLCDS